MASFTGVFGSWCVLGFFVSTLCFMAGPLPLFFPSWLWISYLTYGPGDSVSEGGSILAFMFSRETSDNFLIFLRPTMSICFWSESFLGEDYLSEDKLLRLELRDMDSCSALVRFLAVLLLLRLSYSELKCLSWTMSDDYLEDLAIWLTAFIPN